MRRNGFSLLELVAAMTILVAVISMLGRIVTDTQRAWRQGTDQAELALNARAAFAILDADISVAVADTNLVFALTQDDTGVPLHGTNAATSLLFYRLAPTAADAGNRSIQSVHVFATPEAEGAYRSIFRERRYVPADEPYPPDWETWADTNIASQVILENIVELRIRATYPTEVEAPEAMIGAALETADSYFSDDHGFRLPALVDLEVALLPRRTAERLRTGTPEERLRQATWFSHRIHLRNREGGYLP